MQRVSHFFSILIVFGIPGLFFGALRLLIRRDHLSMTSAVSGIAASITASILTGFYLQHTGLSEDLIFGFAGLSALIADFLVEILFKSLKSVSDDPLNCFERWMKLFLRRRD